MLFGPKHSSPMCQFNAMLLTNHCIQVYVKRTKISWGCSYSPPTCNVKWIQLKPQVDRSTGQGSLNTNEWKQESIRKKKYESQYLWNQGEFLQLRLDEVAFLRGKNMSNSWFGNVLGLSITLTIEHVVRSRWKW